MIITLYNGIIIACLIKKGLIGMDERKLNNILNAAVNNEDNWLEIPTMAGEEYLKHCQEINDRNEIISKRDSVTYQRALFCTIG